jgi:hypothetical protein
VSLAFSLISIEETLLALRPSYAARQLPATEHSVRDEPSAKVTLSQVKPYFKAATEKLSKAEYGISIKLDMLSIIALL